MKPRQSPRFAVWSVTIATISAFSIAGCRKDIEQNRSQSVGIAANSDRNDKATFTRTVPVGAYMSNEVLVRFKDGITGDNIGRALSVISAEVSERILTQTMESAGDMQGIYLLHTPLDVPQAISKLQDLTEVEYAEPNYIYTIGAVSNDPYYVNGSLWGMYGSATTPANQYGSRAGSAWANGNTGSSSVLVGIIDEGVMRTHEDLVANCWVNPYETLNGKDDDGNGYKDDKYGWNFVNNNNNTFDKNNDDHGTHVAGTIGATGGNGKGVAGMCWNVKMIPAKFLGANGGTTANAIKAVDYITGLKIKHNLKIVATNNSWGGGGFSQSLKSAIDRAANAGILFIAAAGNASSNNDAVANYPSNYTSSNIIAVASITSAGGLSSFSNYGATMVDIGAPGSSIYSSLPVLVGGNATSGYGSYSGTSMATPHVTGAAALYAATHPAATATDIKNAILNSAIATPSLTGKCVTGGRLNASGF